MNTEKSYKKYLWLLSLLVVVLFCGCWLFSGTWVIIYKVEQADIDSNPDHTFYKFTVDLTRESVWQDHKGDLDNIEDVAITFKLINHLSTVATGQVYVSTDSTLSDTTVVKSSAIKILDGISVPGNDSLYVNMADYYDLLLNFKPFRDVVKTGVFTAYAIVPNTLDIEFRDVVVVVTFSAGM